MLGQHIVQVMADDWERVRQHDPREHPLATFIRQSYKYLEIPFPPDLGRRLEGLGKTELHRGDTVRVGREAHLCWPWTLRSSGHKKSAVVQRSRGLELVR